MHVTFLREGLRTFSMSRGCLTAKQTCFLYCGSASVQVGQVALCRDQSFLHSNWTVSGGRKLLMPLWERVATGLRVAMSA